MCGIVAVIGPQIDPDRLAAAVQAIRHRGPDDQSTRVAVLPDAREVGLGHARLSIIDVHQHANQPMTSADGRVTVVYNGEIYNHLELRAQLGGEDVPWRTTSDTEVLLEGFARHGRDFLPRLNGIFAAVFVEHDSGRVTAVRDPMGVKPLYWRCEDDHIMFASEIRALRVLSDEALAPEDAAIFEFLQTGFVHEPRSGVRGVHKLPPGTTIEIDGRGHVGEPASFRYVLRPAQPVLRLDADAVIAAVRRQLIADVKLGLFYSGGVDSLALACAADVDLVFARFDATDASERAAIAAEREHALACARRLGRPVLEIDCSDECRTADEFLAAAARVAAGVEEPISDFTYFASYQLAHAAALRGYKAMLGGMGGDELFTAYPRHAVVGSRRWRLAMAALHLPPARALVARRPRYARLIERFESHFAEPDPAMAYLRLVGYLSTDEIAALWRGDVAHGQQALLDELRRSVPRGYESAKAQAFALDFLGFLSHNLTVADKSSMAASLELRVPLLDCGLYESAAAAHLRGAPVVGKGVLHEVIRRRLGADWRPARKRGFNPPLTDLIRRVGPRRLRELLGSSAMTRRLSIQAIETILQDHFDGRADNTFKLWQLLFLALWLESMESAVA